MSRLWNIGEMYSIMLKKLSSNKVIHRRERKESIRRGSTQYHIATMFHHIKCFWNRCNIAWPIRGEPSSAWPVPITAECNVLETQVSRMRGQAVNKMSKAISLLYNCSNVCVCVCFFLFF